MKTRGILYVTTGEKFIRGAMRSAKTVHRYCPDLPIHLFADWKSYDFPFDQSPFPFNSVGIVNSPHPRSKVDYLQHTPFDQTLYLDSDTALNADITGLFGLLERFDIALGHAHRRNNLVRLAKWRLEIPRAFPQYNGGVILFRKTPAVMDFLKDWKRCYHEADLQFDQTTLRELLWLSDLRIATLPPEYNVHFLKYHLLWSKTEAKTKIFHHKAFQMGWPRWINKRIRATWLARKLRLGWLVNFIKKLIYRA